MELPIVPFARTTVLTEEPVQAVDVLVTLVTLEKTVELLFHGVASIWTNSTVLLDTWTLLPLLSEMTSPEPILTKLKTLFTSI